MKKLSLILAGALLLGGISFASPVVKQQAEKGLVGHKDTKPTAKSTKSGKVAKKTPVKKAAAAKATTK